MARRKHVATGHHRRRLAEALHAISTRHGRDRPAQRNIRWLYSLDLRADLAEITAPTLVVHSSDGIVPLAQGRWLAEHIAQSRFVIVDRVGRLGADVRDGDLLADPVEHFLTGTTNATPTRRLVTLLFSDIVGSTALGASAGDRSWTDLMSRHDELRARRNRARGRLRREDPRGRISGDVYLADGGSALRSRDRRPVPISRCRGARRNSRRAKSKTSVTTSRESLFALARRVCDLAGSGEVLVSETMHGLLLGSDDRARRPRHARAQRRSGHVAPVRRRLRTVD